MENSTPQNTQSTNKKRAQLTSLIVLAVLVILSTMMLIMYPLMNKPSDKNTAKTTESTQNNSGSTSNSTSKSTTQSTTEFAFNHESDINLSSNKPNIYIFWGDGCPHCKALSKFISKLPAETKNKVNIYSFEVWSDKDNKAFMKKFGKYLGQDVSGVPFMVIGDKIFDGYSSGDTKTDQQILDAINTIIKNQGSTDQYKLYKKA
ncbi:thioredoxin family protein [TM7 phylum sp. oral taxon 351]|nr:thioredoxin family protein [TM7 phylum sp. oral taxon 351]